MIKMMQSAREKLDSYCKICVLSRRLERERLAEKLRQKEVLERELNRERAALQGQLIKQAKLNEIIRQKDLFEKELRKEKNELQVTYCHFSKNKMG